MGKLSQGYMIISQELPDAKAVKKNYFTFGDAWIINVN